MAALPEDWYIGGPDRTTGRRRPRPRIRADLNRGRGRSPRDPIRRVPDPPGAPALAKPPRPPVRGGERPCLSTEHRAARRPGLRRRPAAPGSGSAKLDAGWATSAETGTSVLSTSLGVTGRGRGLVPHGGEEGAEAGGQTRLEDPRADVRCQQARRLRTGTVRLGVTKDAMGVPALDWGADPGLALYVTSPAAVLPVGPCRTGRRTGRSRWRRSPRGSPAR